MVRILYNDRSVVLTDKPIDYVLAQFDASGLDEQTDLELFPMDLGVLAVTDLETGEEY